MCTVFHWSSLLIIWGVISFTSCLAMINIGVATRLRRERAEYQQLLEAMTHEHVRYMLEHMEVAN